jgi:hypothetical protein
MTGYHCCHCPIAFEIGAYGYWDTAGHCVKLVCAHCGTMSMAETERTTTTLSVQPGPMLAMVTETRKDCADHNFEFTSLPYLAWQLVGAVPTPPNPLLLERSRPFTDWLKTLTCAHCGNRGQLVARLAATDTSDGFVEHCPLCSKPIDLVYVDTIN